MARSWNVLALCTLLATAAAQTDDPTTAAPDEITTASADCTGIFDEATAQGANVRQLSEACQSNVIPHGTECQVECPSGKSFVVPGDFSTTCQNGEWTNAIPQCEETDQCAISHTCNPATSNCVDLPAPATGHDCACKPGYGGVPNPNGVPDGSGCQRFSLSMNDPDGNVLTIGGPYGEAVDVKFRFGAESKNREYSVTQMDADIKQTQQDLTTTSDTLKADYESKILTAQGAMESKLTTQISAVNNALGVQATDMNAKLTSTEAALTQTINAKYTELLNKINANDAKLRTDLQDYATTSSVNANDATVTANLKSWVNSNFYSQTYISTNFYTKSYINSELYTRAQTDSNVQALRTYVDGNYYTRSYLSTNFATQSWASSTFATASWVNANFYNRATSDGLFLPKQHKMWSGYCSYHGQNRCNWMNYCFNVVERDTLGGMMTRGGDYFRINTAGYYRLNWWAIQHTGDWNWRHVRMINAGTDRYYNHEYHHTWKTQYLDQTWWFGGGQTIYISVYACGNNVYNWHSGNANGQHSRMQLSYLGDL